MLPSEQKPKKKGPSFGFDGLILGIAGLLLLGAVFLLFKDDLISGGQIGDKKLTAVGRFVSSRNDVRRRVEAGLSWNPANVTDTVYEGDSIFTGDESEAAVKLDKGGQLSIDAKSLVVVRTQGSQVEVDLQYGSLVGKVANNSPIILNQGGVKQELSAQNAEVRIVRSEKSKETRIQVVKGEIVMREKKQGALNFAGLAKTEQKVIRQNEFIEVSPEKKAVVKKIPVVLLEPTTGQKLWLPPGKPLQFQWKVDPSAASTSYSIEFSRDSSFDEPFFKAPVQGSSFDLAEDKRPAGQFHWRVTPNAQDPGLLASLPWRLTVFPDLAPTPLAPTDNQVISLGETENQKSVEFSWSDKAGAAEFELQIAKDDQFKDILIDKKVTGLKDTTPLAAGHYKWRVMGLNIDRPNAPWSKTQTLDIKAAAKTPDVPVLAKTQIDYQIPDAALKRMPASVPSSDRGIAAQDISSFSWSPVEHAVEYDVEFASSETFENAKKQPVREPQFAPKEVRPGSYFVRVQAKGADGKLSPPSAPGRLNVFLPPPQVSAMKSETKKYKTPEELESGTHEFQVKWSPQPFAEGYELEWGADPEFAQSKKFRVKEASRGIAVSKPMDYLARVRSLDATGAPLSAFSQPQVASFKKELLPPPTPSPTPVPTPSPTPEPIAPMPASNSTIPGAPPAGGPDALKPESAQQASAEDAATKAAKAAKDPNVAGLNPLIKSPSLSEPRADTVLVSLDNSTNFVNFKWSPVSGAKFYTIQFAQDAEFTKVIGEAKAPKSAILHQQKFPAGKVYWRVRAHKGAKFSEWSSPSDISVMHE